MPEESKAAASPTAPIPAVPTAPIPTGPSNFLTFIPSSIKICVIAPISFTRFLFRGLYCTLYSLSGSSPAKVAPTSRFEIDSSSTTVPNPVSEVDAFFVHFEQAETNNLDAADF